MLVRRSNIKDSIEIPVVKKKRYNDFLEIFLEDEV